MSRRFLFAVPISLAVHVVVASAVFLLLSRDLSPPVLFIDLTDVALTEPPEPPRPAPPATRERKRPLEVRAAPRPPAPITPPLAPPAAPIEPKPEITITTPPAAAPEVVAPAVAPPVAPDERAPQVASDRQQRMAAPSPFSDPTPASAGAGPAPVAPGTVADATPAAATRGQSGGTGTADGQSNNVAVATGSSGGSVDGNYLGYLSLVRRRLHETLEYPSAARRRNLAGTVHVEIVIRVDGSIGEVIVAQSSSHAILDQVAVDAVRRLPKFPFPAGLEPRTLRVRLPVVFQLQ